MNEPLIYLDHAATTSVLPEVVTTMLPYFHKEYANPSSAYGFAQKSKAVINDCREKIAESIGAKACEIYFTSGGSESDNWAIKGVAKCYGCAGLKSFTDEKLRRNDLIGIDGKYNMGRHIITTKIEHHAVLNTCEFIEEMGYDVTYLDVDENGMVKLDVLKKAIRPDTFLISVMFANNEIGTIEPIKEIGEIAHANNIIFHTDAVQAYGHIPINVDEYNIDMLSVSAHKLNGPKGIGFLYVREGVDIKSFIHGGGQEGGKRAGTENVPAIVGFAKACEIGVNTMTERASKEMMLRDHMINRILHEVPYARLNGHRTKRLSNNANFSFQFIEGESMLVMLDMAGICASSGSACSSGSGAPSHVIMALGLPADIAYGSVRFTLGHENTVREIDYAVDKIKDYAKKLRDASPQYEDYLKSKVI